MGCQGLWHTGGCGKGRAAAGGGLRQRAATLPSDTVPSPRVPQRGARFPTAGRPLPAGAEPHRGRHRAGLPPDGAGGGSGGDGGGRDHLTTQAGAVARVEAAGKAGREEIPAQMLLVPVSAVSPERGGTVPALTPCPPLLPPSLPPSHGRVWVAPAFLFLTIPLNAGSSGVETARGAAAVI